MVILPSNTELLLFLDYELHGIITLRTFLRVFARLENTTRQFASPKTRCIDSIVESCKSLYWDPSTVFVSRMFGSQACEHLARPSRR